MKKKENSFQALLMLFIAALFALFSGCKSLQSATDISYRDSIIEHHVFDTIHVTIYDSVRVESSSENEKESTTELTFGEGGGTYNSQTGEATNVTSVKQSSREKELQSLVTLQKHTIDSQAVRIDSLGSVITKLETHEEVQQNTEQIKPKRSGWDRFCTWWTIGSWLLILAMAGIWVFKKFYLHR